MKQLLLAGVLLYCLSFFFNRKVAHRIESTFLRASSICTMQIQYKIIKNISDIIPKESAWMYGARVCSKSMKEKIFKAYTQQQKTAVATEMLNN